MGYAKYCEDNLKILNNRLYMKSAGIPVPSVPKLRSCECRYCHLTFHNKQSLFSHIRKAHNLIYPLVEINGRIAQTNNHIVELNSVLIYLYGNYQDIIVGNSTIGYDMTDETIDITAITAEVLNKTGKCHIKVGTDTVTLQLTSSDLIRWNVVLPIIKKWDKLASEKLPIVYYENSELNSAERLYLDGFYNYYLAVNLSAGEQGKRYDDAFTILSNFHLLDSTGRCVMKVIAFRRNWIRKLIDLCNGDVYDEFAEICDFYRNTETCCNLKTEMTDAQMYIEDGIREDMTMILEYQRSSEKAMYLSEQRIPQILPSDDKNRKDRKLLIAARAAAMAGDTECAIDCYEEVLSPWFRSEGAGYKQFVHKERL